MVMHGKHVKRILLVLALILCVVFIFTGWALAQQEEEEAEPVITEEYKVTINDVGDGHIVDTIKYSESDFEQIKKAVEDNENFLTRRFTSDTNMGEVVNFDTKLDDANDCVILTFDTPGYAYKLKDYWVLFGFAEKPKKESGKTIEFESQEDVNNEFTLFSTLPIKTNTIIELPKDATNIKYDSDDSAIKFEMPKAKSLLGFWSENRNLLSIIFSALALAFLGLFILVITRKTREKPSPAKVPAAAVPPVPPTMAGPPPSMGAPPPPATEAKKTRFCRHCGGEIARDRKFCAHCGKQV